MFQHRIEDPTKGDLESVARLVNMLDFLRGDLKPFSAIAKEAVKRKIINKSEVNSLYNSFVRVDKRVKLFEGKFFPDDQSPSRMDRWEYRVPSKMREEDFRKEIIVYANANFKRKFNMKAFEIDKGYQRLLIIDSR